MKENNVHLPKHTDMVSDTDWRSRNSPHDLAFDVDDERRDVAMITLTWNGEEGKLQISKDFVISPRMVQLDGLVDWIAELQDIYDALLRKGTHDRS
jgi:hypothetical protein